jgi:ABC transporter DrrB family efflux protein
MRRQAIVPAATRLPWSVVDAYTATRRYLRRGMRQPDVIFGSVLIPIIFVVLFGYVFGGSIKVPGGNYRSYLMPGLFGQAILFGSNSVAVGIATDMSEGVIDRFKTLPIARSAIVIGRAISSLLLGIPAMVVMILCALAVGWRPTGGLGNAALAFGLYELFGFAAIWLGILVGLLAQSSQAADVIMGIPTFLLGFISNVFVDPANMPAWLRVFADWNPMSAMVTAGRQLFGNSIGPPPPGVWSLDHPVVTTIGLSIVIVAIVAPFCVRRYSRVSR